MGYYTSFNLKSVAPDSKANRKVINEAFESLTGHNPFEGNTLKWYSFERDALKISAELPYLAFKIVGYGENYEDIWAKEYYGGRKVNEWKFEGVPLELSAETQELVERSMTEDQRLNNEIKVKFPQHLGLSEASTAENFMSELIASGVATEFFVGYLASGSYQANIKMPLNNWKSTKLCYNSSLLLALKQSLIAE
jgi:hypothetical protein